MKVTTIITTILYVLIFSMFIFAYEGGGVRSYDFRKASWGMSKKEVKESETLSVIKYEDENLLVYLDVIFGMETHIVYIFADSKLTRAKYMFDPKHTYKNDYILNYDNLKKMLKNKYGLPGTDGIYWRDDLYKSDYSKWGFAISLGHLAFVSRWSTENTDIILMLYGENYRIELVIEYTSKLLKELEKESDHKKIMDTF